MERFICPGILSGALLLGAVSLSFASVKPNSLFSDNAILQRGISVPVWGSADPGEKVMVKFQDQSVSAKAGKDGRWQVRLKPLEAGGPFSMTISGSNSIELKNIAVGEVWAASGQSNMGIPLQQATGGAEAASSSSDPMFRIYQVPLVPADQPLSDCNGTWTEAAPTNTQNMSAVAYYFARDLRRALGVPVGIIQCAWGGTRVEAWTSARCLKTYPENEAVFANLPDYAKKPNVPSVLYNGMIAPIIPYGIRGAIWYQGESNAGRAWDYRQLFPAMIRNWRDDWGEGDFPFYFVQLAPFWKIVQEPEDSGWAELRDVQLWTTRNVPNTAMAVITDVGDPDDIHPKQKEPVGGRLALAARALTYGEKVPFKGPECASVEFKGDRAVLTMQSNGGKLMAKGGDLTGFTIAGDDHKFHNARASIQGDRIVVSSPDVPKPIAVRYGWFNCPVVNLWNEAGLPASPFRTDDFPMITTPKQPPTDKISSAVYKPMTGTFLQLDGGNLSYTAKQWRSELEAIKELGMDTLIIGEVARDDFGFCKLGDYPILPRCGTQDPVQTILDIAAELKIRVMMGLYAWDWKRQTPESFEEYTKRCIAISDEVWNRYGAHKAFAGWYCLGWELGNTAPLDNIGVKAYLAVIPHLRQISPKMPILISPYFTLDCSVQQWQEGWSKMLPALKPDIVALQDGVGCGRHLTPRNVKPYFEALQKICQENKVRFWSDVEVFDSPPFVPAPPDRVIEQLKSVAPYVEKTVIFEFNHYMSPNRTDNKPAKSLYDAILKLQGINT